MSRTHIKRWLKMVKEKIADIGSEKRGTAVKRKY